MNFILFYMELLISISEKPPPQLRRGKIVVVVKRGWVVWMRGGRRDGGVGADQ